MSHRTSSMRPRLRVGTLRTLALLALTALAVTAGAPNVIRVHRGDTLSEIAKQRHTTVALLQALNHMGGSTLIYAGQTLVVPGAPTRARAAVPASKAGVGHYTVRPGDGLIVVARRLHTTPQALTALNHLHRDYLILGESLRYPVRTASPAPASTTRGIPGSVTHSATVHRAQLAARAVPSKAAVQDLIRRAAARHGVPADLVLALAYQESGFQQRVVSPVDAIGAMQVLPSTAQALSRLHGRHFDLLKASDNVEAGVLLVRDLLQATGSVEKALAGYYQGLGSISRKGLLPQTIQYVRNITTLRARFS